MLERLGAEVGWRSATEVDELWFTTINKWFVRIHLQLIDNGIDIALDFCSVLVGVDTEIAEVTALSAERDVRVDSERRAGGWLAGNDIENFRDGFLLPERVWRVVGNKVVSGLGFLVTKHF